MMLWKRFLHIGEMVSLSQKDLDGQDVQLQLIAEEQQGHLQGHMLLHDHLSTWNFELSYI